jgi:hypothetical protein
MINSLMRKAASDNNAWNARHHKVNFDCNEQFVDDTVVTDENFGL